MFLENFGCSENETATEASVFLAGNGSEAEAKICQFYAAEFVDEDVSGFDVTVGDSFFVAVDEGGDDLASYFDETFECESVCFFDFVVK